MYVSKKSWPLKVLGTVCVILFMVIQIYPVIWMLLSSLKDPTEFYTKPMFALPNGLYLSNYAEAWTRGNVMRYFINSTYIVAIVLVAISIFGSMAAFAIVKMKWKLSQFVLTLILLGIMIPVHIMMIPLFIMYSQAHILNTHFSLIIAYIAFSLPLTIYLLSASYKRLPNEVMEAAVIDGGNIFHCFTRVILPMSKNALVTVATVLFFFNWNDLIVSMTFISKKDLKTLQPGLFEFSGSYGAVDWGPMFAAMCIGTIPTILLYLFLNQKVIEGMAAGAVKG